MKNVRFFKPFVGANYHKGINGKKVLVVGASFYCNKLDCKFFSECTDVVVIWGKVIKDEVVPTKHPKPTYFRGKGITLKSKNAEGNPNITE